MTNIYKIIVQSGPGIGTEFSLDKNELFLGRDLTSDLVINDPEVSRRHLRIVLDGAAYRIEDLGSTNGTFIRGQRLSGSVLLKPGEIITLGEKIVLRYEVTGIDANATVVVQRGTGSGTQVQPRPAVPPAAASAPVYAPPPAAAPTPVYAPPPAALTPMYAPPPAAAQAPMYAPPPAAAPVPVYAPQQGVAPKKKSKALLIILILVGIMVLLCIVPWIIIDLTNSYCSLFPGILNMLITNACPV